MGTIRRILTWTAGLLAVLISLAGAYAAYTLANYSWNQVVSYKSPFADYGRPWVSSEDRPVTNAEKDLSWPAPQRTREASETARRVVLIICDGLTLDASKQMTGLNTLRQYGADMVAVTSQPSLSYPSWTNILSGAPPDISGVTTNWFDASVPVETLIDVAVRDGYRTAFSGPEDFKALYGVQRAGASYFSKWNDSSTYMTGTYIDQALKMAESYKPEFLLIHLPDADETAHDYGAASDKYAQVVRQMDADIQRFVTAMQDDRTVFVICADHGHIPTGGHGGWETEVTRVPVVFVGPGTVLGSGTMQQSDIAANVAALLGMRVPAYSTGRIRDDVVLDAAAKMPAGIRQYRAFAGHYATRLDGKATALGDANDYDSIDGALTQIRGAHLAADRASRLPVALALAGGALLALVLLFAASWRGGLAALGGTLAYYVIYDGLYFVVHGYQWSLSAFNTETNVQKFFYTRMGEAAVAALIAVAIAGLLYPSTRREPKGPREGFLSGWLALGPATVLAILATLAIQVAWFLWAWGAQVVWRLPDLHWGFKYDLDLLQATAVGATAVLAPLVTYLVGRYHPKVRARKAEE